MSVTQQAMAGPFKRLNNTFRRWWMSHKDNHFRIVTSLTILSVAATIWGILFLFVLGGTTDQSKEMWVSWSWLGLILGGVGAFWLVPEFLVYLSQKAALDEILLLDSRPEVLRRRKEAEEAAFSSKAKIGMVGLNIPIPVPMAFHSFGGWKRSLFGDQHMHGIEGVRFYTKLKTITSRWPSGIRLNPEFIMPTMK